MNQYPLPSGHVNRTMHHLVGRDVVQHQADSFSWIHPGRHRNQFAYRHANELCVRAMYRERGYDLAGLESGYTLAKLIHDTNQVPPRSEGHGRRFGMNPLASHDVGQGNSRSQYSHPYFTGLGFRAFFLDYAKCIGAAIVGDDDARVFHTAPHHSGNSALTQPVCDAPSPGNGEQQVAPAIGDWM